jgi:alanine or glycine:cation symporter, AGCS family
MHFLLGVNETLNAIVWGPPLIVLLMGAGVFLTIATGLIQVRRFGFAFREVFGKLFRPSKGDGSVTPFQALATALASTVGVGNIAGVSTAIFLGGPGALFWLLVSGFLGMSTKFAEIAVALHYRERDAGGTMRGGAMYVLQNIRGLKWMGSVFALLTAAAAFGIGNMVQANSVAEAAYSSFAVPHWITGTVLAALAASVVLGGIRRIAEVTQVLVPFMCAAYLVGALVVAVRYASQIVPVAQLVLESAFTGHAAAGGFAGATIMTALRFGIARGLFSNEAGLGSAPMVHSSAITDHPVRQAGYGIIEVFIDSMVVCLLTGFVVLATGAWQTGENGAALAGLAFSRGLPGEWGHFIVSASLMLFAFSTIIGWAFYGETGIGYLFGAKAIAPYRMAWIVFVFVGATGSLQTVWSVADTLNGMMAVPNLIAVLVSIPLLRGLISEFFEGRR